MCINKYIWINASSGIFLQKNDLMDEKKPTTDQMVLDVNKKFSKLCE